MAHPILMPKPGQMTEECVIVAWHKNEGDPVTKGDVLFEIETDKANMDVEAFDDGVLLKRYAQEGDTVPVNAICAYVGQPGETVPDVAPAGRAAPAAAPTAPAPAERAPAASVAAPAPAERAPAPSAPAPRPIAAATQPAPAPAGPDGRQAAAGSEVRLRISPRASRLAADSGLDPRTIAGSGPEGRITERDVRAALRAASEAGPAVAVAAQAARAASVAAATPIVGAEAGADEEPPRAMSRMRRVIAERLTQSATTVPQFTVTVAVDMTRLMALRTELKAAGTNLSVTDFIVSAVAQSLAEYPMVNSRTDGVSIWPRSRVQLGLAVALPDGLVVPVIRDADRLSLIDLHDRAAALAEAARNGTLGPDDMSGSTFTISNLGMYGVDEFQAIINPGESAILAVSSVVPMATVLGDGIAIRQKMKLTLTSDHRIVDGELAARFLNAVRRRLEDANAYRGEILNA
jgi:pyruvate dehydrogenase E2 component (dihydrolipoamide acetyltransferase)